MSAMSVERVVYLDTSALAKWYLNETGSEEFVRFIQGVEVAVISSLTRTEIRSLLARRRRMGELDAGLEGVIYATFQDDVSRGHLRLYEISDERFAEAANLIARYPEYPLRTLDALHLAVARHWGIEAMATADGAMADAAAGMGFKVTAFRG
jgi:hypothetical protein